MIIVKASKTKKGVRLKIHSHTLEPFNHFYRDKTDAKRAWTNFVKQIKAGKVKLDF